ncbi:glycosyltransferase family 4 protein [Marinihelvus fidelis]|uniref:Glycosyltransferase family 4 protein n=1 Tax=Marinihelvus fidelis TaxID=2613842 RepID=A0A5N0TAU2_9GAMM|nr:glycosyltransferase family 1 protein [Marinihelvus fidelis]KAA9130936.1 glycosyltransferase family 4 protein [Marinihelvus fidelis]
MKLNPLTFMARIHYYISMRVGLDISQAVKRRGRGIARYIRQVVPALAALPLDGRLEIRAHRWTRRALVADLAPDWPRHCLLLNRAGRELDLFHGFGNHLPGRGRVPLSFTVHDVRALDQPAGYEGRERLIRNLGRADGVLCLTQYGRDRLLHHHPELADRHVAVVPHGVDHGVFNPRPVDEAQATTRRYGLDAPYLLQLGSWFPHKNLELSIRAFAASRARGAGLRLAFVGGGAPDAYLARLRELAATLGVGNDIHWVEHVPGPDLPGLLSASRALLQPSRYEGFALPILEAMACGTPGVVSDSSCLPEVSGGCWPVAGQDDPEAFAAAMDHVALDGQARDQAISDGLAHAAHYTWARCASETAAFFRDTLTRAR